MMIYLYGVLIKPEVKIAAICSVLFLNTVFMDPDWDELHTHVQKKNALGANDSAGFSLAFTLTDPAI